MNTRTLLIAVLLAGVIITGCVRLPREPLEVDRYSIDLPDSTWMADTTFSAILFVPSFQATPQQRGDRIFFRDGDRTMNFYYYHRWVISPEQMIGDVFARALSNSGLFEGGVFQGESGLVPTHEIQGRLVELYANNTRGEYKATLELKLTLLGIDPNTYQKQVLLQKSYPIDVDRKNDTVESHVEAVNEAVAIWLDEAMKDVEASLVGE